MSSSANIRAGAAYVELSVNNSALVRDLQAAQKRLKGFASSVTAVGKRMMLMTGAMAMPFVTGVKTENAITALVSAWLMVSIKSLSTPDCQIRRFPSRPGCSSMPPAVRSATTRASYA